MTDLDLVGALHEPASDERAEQLELLDLVVQGRADEAFELAFEIGDELFETQFNALDGVGANGGQGQRFTRVPRADLVGRAAALDLVLSCVSADFARVPGPAPSRATRATARPTTTAPGWRSTTSTAIRSTRASSRASSSATRRTSSPPARCGAWPRR